MIVGGLEKANINRKNQPFQKIRTEFWCELGGAKKLDEINFKRIKWF